MIIYYTKATAKAEVLTKKIIPFRGGSRTAATCKMERFVIIVNGF